MAKHREDDQDGGGRREQAPTLPRSRAGDPVRQIGRWE